MDFIKRLFSKVFNTKVKKGTNFTCDNISVNIVKEDKVKNTLEFYKLKQTNLNFECVKTYIEDNKIFYVLECISHPNVRMHLTAGYLEILFNRIENKVEIS